MKRKIPLTDQLYRYFYPEPKPENHQSWAALVRKELAREARFEAKMFYGDDWGETVLQPGNDYAGAHVRCRFRRFPFHAILFAAFDSLGLTRWEIYKICTWDCTLYARDAAQAKYPEMKIDDDTGDDIPKWDDLVAERQLVSAVSDTDTLAHAADVDDLDDSIYHDESEDSGFVNIGRDVPMDDSFQELPLLQGVYQTGSISIPATTSSPSWQPPPLVRG